jgi:peptide/nickel transport system substrate-binding protein
MDDTQRYWQSAAAGEGVYNVQDLPRAREYLATSGYAGEDFVILTAPMGNMNNGALVIQQQLAAIGIKVTVTSLDWAAVMDRVQRSDQWHLYTTSFAAVPVPTLRPYLAPDNPGWSRDPKLQAHMSAFRAAETREAARAAWDAAQAYCWDYLPVLHLGHHVAAYAWNNRVETPQVYGGLFFWNAAVRN